MSSSAESTAHLSNRDIRSEAQGQRYSIVWTIDSKASEAIAEDRAEVARAHLSHLIECGKRKIPLDISTLDWLTQLGDREHAKLSSKGIVQERETDSGSGGTTVSLSL